MEWCMSPASFLYLWISICPSTICWKDYPLLNGLSTLAENQLAVHVWAYVSILIPIPPCLHYYSFIVTSEIRNWILQICFSFSVLFWLFRACCITYEIWESTFPFEILIGIVLNLQIALGGPAILTALSLAIHDSEISSSNIL